MTRPDALSMREALTDELPISSPRRVSDIVGPPIFGASLAENMSEARRKVRGSRWRVTAD
jgi:hypothetical protein